jgi:hypothetical protein
MVLANELRGIVHQGHALAGMLYLTARRSASLTGQEVHGACRPPRASARPPREGEKIALGRGLIEIKARLPHGHFGPWLAEHGISADRANRCMRLAREGTAAESERPRIAARR